MTLARAFSGPTRRGIHRQKVVAIDTQARNAIPGAARSKRRRFTRRKALKGGDSPLVVHHVQHARRAVGAGEQQGMMEIRFGAGALANPTRCHMVFALDGRSHGPAHCLRKLRGQVTRDRKQAGRARVIHHGQLPALAHVARVRQQLVHQRHQRLTTHHLQALVAIAGKQHVVRLKRHGGSHRHRFLAGALHVERDAALPLRLLHALIEQPRQQHMPQAHLQFGGFEVRVPRTHRPVFVVEHTHHLRGQVHGGRRHRIEASARVGPRDSTGGRKTQVTEVGRLPGPG